MGAAYTVHPGAEVSDSCTSSVSGELDLSVYDPNGFLRLQGQQYPRPE
ncbi:phospholipase domain-containing protein [Tunturiibacter gelidiferens]